MIIRPMDLETTSLEPSAEVIEIGAYDIRGIGDDTQVPHLYTTGLHSFVKPAAPIPYTASAIHHITDADVASAPAWNVAWKKLIDTGDDYEVSDIIFAAHMASFERQFLDPLIHAKWICTWKCSLRLFPHFDSHSLQSMRYALKLDDLYYAQDSLMMPPHRALPDAYVCGLLVLELMNLVPVQTLVEWSEQPAVFTKFDFGQFNGKPLSAADNGYLEFIAFKADKMSDDWRWNAKREIERRSQAAEQAKVDARKAYLDRALAALPRAAVIADLEAWYSGEAAERAKHGFLPGTDEYDALIGACAARKKVLADSGQPNFGASA